MLQIQVTIAYHVSVSIQTLNNLLNKPRFFSAASILWIGMFFISVSAHSQTISAVGNDNIFEVATWNIEWFGDTNQQPSNDALQLSNARRVILESGVDLWGVQEISSESAFESLISDLGSNYAGQLATNSGTQRVGFIYNTDVIRVRQVRHILESSESAFAFRPPLQMEADVILPDTTVIVTFIVVHMKARADLDSYERRTTASTRLKSHIDFTTLSSKPVIVLGDFNDELTRSIFAGRTTPYDNFLADTDNYRFLSYPLEMAGDGSFCSSSACTSTSSMIDHILITDELFAEVDPIEAIGILDQAPDVINAFGASTSDHLPVYARFSFNGSVASNNEKELPIGFEIQSPYPNPFSNSSTISYTVDTPTTVRMDVYNVMGQLIWTQNEGTVMPGVYDHSIDLSWYGSGTYFLRVNVNGFTETYPLILARN